MTVYGMKMIAGSLAMHMWKLVRCPKTLAAKERFEEFLEEHLDNLFTLLRFPSADATN
ncbi:thioredoxin domain-containing protein [Rhodopirellula baltica]|nr:hypothetical protein [Rhodopirellula baltica]